MLNWEQFQRQEETRVAKAMLNAKRAPSNIVRPSEKMNYSAVSYFTVGGFPGLDRLKADRESNAPDACADCRGKGITANAEVNKHRTHWMQYGVCSACKGTGKRKSA